MTGRVAFALALACSVAALYRSSPAVPVELRKTHCRVPVPLVADIVSDMVCDGPSFMFLASRPERLLSSTSQWQSRPLYVLSGTLLGAPFGSFAAHNRARMRATYLGFVAFNVLALASAVLLFQLLLVGSDPFVVGALALALLANDVVKTLVWSPHLQMMSILQPLLLVWLLHHVATRAAFSLRRAVAYALVAGLAPLVYGSGLLLLPALLIGLLLRADVRRGLAATQAIGAASMLAAVFLLPTAGWVGFIVARNGSFYSHEVRGYRQFVWIADRLVDAGPIAVAGDLAVAFAAFWERFLIIGWFPLAIFAAALLLAALDRDALRSTLRDSRVLLAACLAAWVLDVAFFVALGFYSERLSLNAAPPLLVASGLLLAPLVANATPARRNALRAALLAATLCWTGWHVARPGPWSFQQNVLRAGPEGIRPPPARETRGSPDVEVDAEP
jgi:hypothetical protein